MLVALPMLLFKQCINHAMYNSNSGLGYKFAFYRYAFNKDVFCTMKHAISKITVHALTHDQFALEEFENVIRF